MIIGCGVRLVRDNLGRPLAALAAFIAFCSAVPAFADQEPEAPKVLQVGFSSKVFQDIDKRDAQAAMELWAKQLSRSSGVPGAQVTIFHDTAALQRAVRKKKTHLVTMSAIEYLKIHDGLPITPAFVATNKVGRNMDQLLIVHRNSGIRKVKDLRGRSFAILPSAKLEAGRIWLNVFLVKNGVSEGTACFRQVKEFSRASQAIMGVFFGQVDGAVVSRGSFETCNTLNPQLAKDLVVIAESKSLMGDVTCMPTYISDRLRSAIERAAMHLHESNVGRQILTLFQIDRVARFRETDMDGITELLAEQAALRANRGNMP